MQWLVDAVYDKVVAMLGALASLIGVTPSDGDMIIGDSGLWTTQPYVDWQDATANFKTSGQGDFGGPVQIRDDLELNHNDLLEVVNAEFDVVELTHAALTPFNFRKHGDALAIECQRSGYAPQFGFWPKDADGTDGVQLVVWWKGTIGGGGVREFFRALFTKSPTNTLTLHTHATGGGTVRPMILEAGSGSGHLKLQPDGDTEVGGGPLDFTFAMGSSSKDPRAVLPDDWIEAKIAGVTGYVPFYYA